MNIPNILTLARIALVPLFLVLLHQEFRIAALAIFALAATTDFFDGYLARKLNQITTFGKIFDPLADKLLVVAALIFFVYEQTVPPWVVIVVIAREFLVSLIRIVAATAKVDLAAVMPGKIKTVIHMLAIIAILTPWHDINILPILAQGFTIYNLASWLIALSAIWAGVDYIIRYRKVISIK